jgi:hypothetical protein
MAARGDRGASVRSKRHEISQASSRRHQGHLLLPEEGIAFDRHLTEFCIAKDLPDSIKHLEANEKRRISAMLRQHDYQPLDIPGGTFCTVRDYCESCRFVAVDRSLSRSAEQHHLRGPRYAEFVKWFPDQPAVLVKLIEDLAARHAAAMERFLSERRQEA